MININKWQYLQEVVAHRQIHFQMRLEHKVLHLDLKGFHYKFWLVEQYMEAPHNLYLMGSFQEMLLAS